MTALYTIPNWQLSYLPEGWLIGTPVGTFRVLGNNGLGLVMEPISLVDVEPSYCSNCVTHLRNSYNKEIEFKDIGKDI